MKKNRVLRCYIQVILICGLIFSFSSIALGEDDTITSKSLSLEQAIALGVENNDNITLAKLAVEANKINLEQTQFRAKKLQKTLDDPDMYFAEDVYSVLYFNPAQAELGYELAQSTLNYTENKVKYGIETAYYGLQVADKALEAADLAWKRNETQLNNVKAKVNQGLASKLDLYNAEANLLKSQADYMSTKDAADYATMLLDQMLGLDVTNKLIPTDELSMVENGEISFEEAFSKAQTTDLTYLTAKNNYDSSDLISDYTQKFSSPNTFDYEKAEVSRQQALVACDNAGTDLEIRVYYSYNKLNTAYTNYQALTKSHDLATEAYRLATLRYKSGLATVYDIQNAETLLELAESALLDAEKDYNLAIASFRYSIYPDPEDDSEE